MLYIIVLTLVIFAGAIFFNDIWRAIKRSNLPTIVKIILYIIQILLFGIMFAIGFIGITLLFYRTPNSK